ncbi:GDSL-type esterase/lipase family protein [Novosphingobium sp. BL-8H]|uniref:GDSL-type esterase/lipase family protein n=1 Tax=Novosphingobium sp. BL-8H TaxID=3127640 RepID=UPI0037570930
MVVRLRILVLGLFLAGLVLVGHSLWQNQRRARLVGLTDTACTPAGRSVTGSDYDDWGGLCFYRTSNAALRREGLHPDVVMIGDSITMGWPTLGTQVVNRGIGGQTSSQILLRFRQDSLDLGPRIIHLLLGSNDVFGLTGPVTLDQIDGNVRTMAEQARLHGAVLIVGTLPPSKGFGRLFEADPTPAIDRVNARLRQIARQQGLILADYHAALVRPDGSIREDLFVDGVHPNAAGYAAMQPIFRTALSQAELRRRQIAAQ